MVIHQVEDNKYKVSLVVRGSEVLQEEYTENASRIREVLRDAYRLSVGDKEEVHLHFFGSLEAIPVICVHQVTVLPGDSPHSLKTGYYASICTPDRKGTFAEDAIRTLQEMRASGWVAGSPRECWLAIVTGLMMALGEVVDTRIALENQTGVGETISNIVCEILGGMVWTGDGLGFYGTKDMHLAAVVDDLSDSIALMEQKLLSEPNRQAGSPASSVQFWYLAYRISSWGVVVSFPYGKYTKVTARDKEIVVETSVGNTVITTRMRPEPKLFISTRENWMRALRTATSVISADTADVEKILQQDGWGEPLFPAYLNR